MRSEEGVGEPPEEEGLAHATRQTHVHQGLLESQSIQSGHVVSAQFRVALDLATRAGLPMVRLRAGSNVPNLERWPERATSDPVALAALNAERPDSNWGVLTGSGVGVLDFDTKSDPHGYGGYATVIDLEEMIDLSGWKPPVVKTASGEHWYFRYEGTLPTQVGWMPHLDVKADGGSQVAAPGTVRVLGGRELRYELVRGDLAAIPRAPEALLSLMRGSRTRSITAYSSRGLSVPGGLPSDDEALVHGLPLGQRSNMMHALACRWWGVYGLANEAAVRSRAYQVWLATPGHDSFTWPEALGTVQSAERYMARRIPEEARAISAWMRARFER